MSTIEGAPQNVKVASELIYRVPMPGKSIRVSRTNHSLEAPERHRLSVLKGIPKSWRCLRDWGSLRPLGVPQNPGGATDWPGHRRIRMIFLSLVGTLEAGERFGTVGCKKAVGHFQR